MSRSSLRLALIAAALLLAGSRGEASPAFYPHASVAGDFDGDGLPDRVVIVHDGLRVRLSHVHGPRQLLFPTHRDIVGLAICDVDLDGDADLLALRRTGQLLLYRNEDGRLTPVAPRSRPRDLTPAPNRVGDGSGDGHSSGLAIASRAGGPSGGLPAARSRLPAVSPARCLAPAPPAYRSPLTSRRKSPRAPPLPSAA